MGLTIYCTMTTREIAVGSGRAGVRAVRPAPGSAIFSIEHAHARVRRNHVSEADYIGVGEIAVAKCRCPIA